MASFLRSTFDNFVNNINSTLSNQNSAPTGTRPNRQSPRGATPSGTSNTRNHTPRNSSGRPPPNTASDLFRRLRGNFVPGATDSRPSDQSARSSSQPPPSCTHRRQPNCPYHSHGHQRDQPSHRHHNQQQQQQHSQQEQHLPHRRHEDNMSSGVNRNNPNIATAAEKLDIGDVRDPSEINNLTAKQLKIILTRNCVDYKGVFEKEVLREKVLQLWIDCNEKKFSGNKGHTQTGHEGSQQNSDDIDESLACKICMDREINCVLLECGHMLTCVTCGRKLAECPICRQNVTRCVRTFRG